MSGSNIAIFDYTAWSAQYPELASSVTSGQATGYFGQATLFVDNTGVGVVPNPQLTTILYLLTSHIAGLALRSSGAGDQAGAIVGRLSGATEGSVSSQFEMGTPGTSEWFKQTRYGAMAWQAMLPWRSAMYVSSPQIPLASQSFPPYLGGSGWPR